MKILGFASSAGQLILLAMGAVIVATGVVLVAVVIAATLVPDLFA
jgi:hypothetical protein